MGFFVCFNCDADAYSMKPDILQCNNNNLLVAFLPNFCLYCSFFLLLRRHMHWYWYICNELILAWLIYQSSSTSDARQNTHCLLCKLTHLQCPDALQPTMPCVNLLTVTPLSHFLVLTYTKTGKTCLLLWNWETCLLPAAYVQWINSIIFKSGSKYDKTFIASTVQKSSSFITISLLTGTFWLLYLNYLFCWDDDQLTVCVK